MSTFPALNMVLPFFDFLLCFPISRDILSPMESYELIRSRRKTLALEITKDCRVLVRAPRSVSQKAIDDFLLYGTVNAQDKAVIDRYHNRSEHKRKPIMQASF